MLTTAQDLMKRELVTVAPSATLTELATLLEEAGIHGVPVVDSAGRPIGVISRSDLLSAITETIDPYQPTQHYYAIADDEIDFDAVEPIPNLTIDAEKTVGDIMSTRLVTAKPSATAGELARLMVRRSVQRVLITAGRALVGIVSASDILKTVADYERRLAATTKRAPAKATGHATGTKKKVTTADKKKSKARGRNS